MWQLPSSQTIVNSLKVECVVIMLPNTTIKPASVTKFYHSTPNVIFPRHDISYARHPPALLGHHLAVGSHPVVFGFWRRYAPVVTDVLQHSCLYPFLLYPLEVPSTPLQNRNGMLIVGALNALVNVWALEDELKGSVSRIKGKLLAEQLARTHQIESKQVLSTVSSTPVPRVELNRLR